MLSKFGITVPSSRPEHPPTRPDPADHERPLSPIPAANSTTAGDAESDAPVPARRPDLHNETPELNGRPGARGSTRRGRSHRDRGCRPAAGRTARQHPHRHRASVARHTDHDTDPAVDSIDLLTASSACAERAERFTVRTTQRTTPTTHRRWSALPSARRPTATRRWTTRFDPRRPTATRRWTTRFDPRRPTATRRWTTRFDPRRPTATRRRTTRLARLITSSRRPVSRTRRRPGESDQRTSHVAARELGPDNGHNLAHGRGTDDRPCHCHDLDDAANGSPPGGSAPAQPRRSVVGDSTHVSESRPIARDGARPPHERHSITALHDGRLSANSVRKRRAVTTLWRVLDRRVDVAAGARRTQPNNPHLLHANIEVHMDVPDHCRPVSSKWRFDVRAVHGWQKRYATSR